MFCTAGKDREAGWSPVAAHTHLDVEIIVVIVVVELVVELVGFVPPLHCGVGGTHRHGLGHRQPRAHLARVCLCASSPASLSLAPQILEKNPMIKSPRRFS
jgi:hypothetical protein